MTQERPLKILVIGSSEPFIGGHFSDGQLHILGNLADYDSIVINSGPFLAQMRERRLSEDRERRDFLDFYTRHTSEKLLELLKSGGSIFVILRATQYIKRPKPPYVIEIDNTPWLPLAISVNAKEGDTITQVEEPADRYFKKVRNWRYVFKPLDYAEIEPGWLAEQRPLARNRADEAIAVTILVFTPGYVAAPPPIASKLRLGRLVLLPPPTEGTMDEAIRVVLEDFCGIQARSAAPQWAASFPMAGAHDLDANIQEKQEAIERLKSDLTRLLTERDRREGFKAILYETGIQALQNVVELVFKELGLCTKPASVSDEFTVEHEGQELLVEVKGNDKSAKLTDLRQLIDYQLEHEQKHGAPIKSVLIVNAWRSLPPDERGSQNTIIFPDNVIRRATDNNIALLHTVELYKALNAFWLGQIDGARIFEILMSRSGVVKLAEQP